MMKLAKIIIIDSDFIINIIITLIFLFYVLFAKGEKINEILREFINYSIIRNDNKKSYMRYSKKNLLKYFSAIVMILFGGSVSMLIRKDVRGETITKETLILYLVYDVLISLIIFLAFLWRVKKHLVNFEKGIEDITMNHKEQKNKINKKRKIIEIFVILIFISFFAVIWIDLFNIANINIIYYLIFLCFLLIIGKITKI